MSPKSYAAVFQIFIFLSYTVFPILACVLINNQSANTIAIILGLGLVFLAFFYWIPVPCQAPSCIGWTKRTMNRVNFWTVKIEYTCKVCSAIHEEKILFPNITFEISG